MEQLANAITFYAFFVASKVGATGLTVTCDIWELTQAGGATEIVTAGSATEIGDGLYKYVLASGSVDAVGEYIAVFKTADATVDQKHIPALWIVGRGGNENLDAAISSRNATTPPTAAAVATAVRSELATELARVDAPISDLPTNAELASALASADDATLAAIATLNNLSSAQAQSAAAAALTAYDPPTYAELASAVAPLATAAALDVVDNLIDTEIGAVKTVTDQLATALELDGAVYRLTANALELAPSDEGGGVAAPTVNEIVDGVWGAATVDFDVAGSTGQALASAGGAADPLLNLVPGSYASGTAGAALGALGNGRITVVQPIISEGNIRIIKGDDYRAVDGRSIDISNDSWVSLTGGAVTWIINGEDFTGSVIGAQTVRLELTSAQTSVLTAGELEYSVAATLANGHKVTLVRSANASVLAVT